jgi:hypothetical protein
LSSNVPLENANNIYTGTNTFNNTLTLTATSQLVLTNTNIYQTGGFTNTMATIAFDTGQNLYFNGGFLTQTTSAGTNTFESISMNSNKNITFSSGSGIINQTLVSSTGTNILKSTSITDLSVSGTLTLPNQSISDLALSANVPLKNAINTFTALNTFNGGLTIPNTLTLYNNAIQDSYLSSNVPLENANNIYTGDNTFATIKFTNSTSVQQITLYEVSPTNYAENYSLTINPSTLRYNTNSTGNHVFSTGSGTTYTDVATINSAGLSMAGKVSLSGSNFIELLDSTNTIASYITQLNQDLDINNFGTGSVIITSPSLDLTNTYTYIQGAELDYGSILAFLDTTQTYATDLYQSSTNFIIENQYNSSTITLRNKDATGTTINHTFAYNAISLNAPITMGTNNNLTMQGSGRIIQASTTSTNVLNPSQFQGDITFAVGVSRINQTGGGNGALLRQLNMLANYDIIFNSGTGKINQTSSTGVNTMGAITMNAGTNLTQTTTSIIDQSSSTGGINLLKAITMVAGTNLTQTTTSIIDQSSSTGGINLLKAITMNANTNFLQSGTSILSQSGTGNNLLKNITQNLDCIISQSGIGGNLFRPSTFSGGAVEITDGPLTLRNATPMNLFDNETIPNQCTAVCSVGDLTFDNYTDPLITSGGGNIKFETFNLTTPIPRFHTRLNINYDGIQVKRGHLKIYNDAETSYLQADQTTTTSTIKNTAVSGSMLLQTTNASSALITNITMTPTSTTIETDLVCSGAAQFNSDLTIYTSGSNYLKLTDNTSTTRQYQSSGDCVIENTKTYAGGFGDIIFSTKDTGGSGAERFRISYNEIKTSVNIELPLTQTTQTSGQLGYIHQGTILNIASPVNNTTGTIYYLASMTLPVGVWNVFAQSCYIFSTGGTIANDITSISTNQSSFSIENIINFTNVIATTGINIYRRLNGIITSTGSTTLYLTFGLTGFSGGAVPQHSNSTQAYTRFYAVRIA